MNIFEKSRRFDEYIKKAGVDIQSDNQKEEYQKFLKAAKQAGDKIFSSLKYANYYANINHRQHKSGLKNINYGRKQKITTKVYNPIADYSEFDAEKLKLRVEATKMVMEEDGTAKYDIMQSLIFPGKILKFKIEK